MPILRPVRRKDHRPARPYFSWGTEYVAVLEASENFISLQHSLVQILEGFHEITLNPTGWLHTQNNRKLRLKDNGAKRYLVTELGISRYEAISSPELAEPFAEEWEKTASYWKAVREAWTRITRRHDSFQLRPKVDGDSLWQHQFAQATEYTERENPEPPKPGRKSIS